MKVKFVVDDDIKKIEQGVNDWLEDNIKEVLDIRTLRMSGKVIGALIVYDELSEEGKIAHQLLN